MRYLIFLLFIFFQSCGIFQDTYTIDNHTLYEVKAGEHDYKPKQPFGGVLSRFKTSEIDAIEYSIWFDSSSIYVHPESDDQIDWNKGGGWSFDLLTNHNNSVMWAWRWTPELQAFEISAYAHISRERFLFDTPYLIVKPYEKFFVTIREYEPKTWRVTLRDSDNAIYKEVKFSTQGKKARRIEPWFGGNNPSPHDGKMYQKIEIKKH